MPLLTIFTPAYNRKHTICRTYESMLHQTCKDFQWLIIDDGSSDGTKEWVLSLAKNLELRSRRFDWMGRPLDEIESLKIGPEMPDDHFVIDVPFAEGTGNLQIEYIYKSNGGLYTGYNVALETIKTELCVCIDSDDYMPDDTVENIVKIWDSLSLDEKAKVGGIAGLDYDVTNGKPLGGLFPVENQMSWIHDLHHAADCKYVFRTAEIKRYAPQIGFEGEKDFNPHYMQMQLFEKLPMMVINKNLCWVEYQIGGDSMSQAIFKQYKRSPRSYAKMRLGEMKLRKHQTFKEQLRINAHYISSCNFSKDTKWLKKSPKKLYTIISIPLGILLNLYIRYKSGK